MHVTAIVPAAGEGRRFSGGLPKQYRSLLGLPVLVRTLRALEAAGVIDRLILVLPPGQEERCRSEVLEPFGAVPEVVVPGGADRQASVYAGLQAVDAATEVVVVHDAARPLVSPELVRAAVAAAEECGAAVVAVPVTDTIKVARPDGTVQETPARGLLWAAQTPQAFQTAVLRAAHQRALVDGVRGTDDAALVERLPHPVRLVPGSPENLKLTTPADLALAEEILRQRGGARAGGPEPPNPGPATSRATCVSRVGIGVDLHRLVADRALVLGGVRIPFERGLDGDSDADVLAHAVLDALLGAAGAGDIGTHFGVGRPEMMGISSLTLLERAVAIVAGRGFRPGNVDATVVAEAPRLTSHVPAMRTALAGVLGLAEEYVNVKATTAKGLGPVGAGEGIAAWAVASVVPMRQSRKRQVRAVRPGGRVRPL